jgi:hypothetical protein
LLVAAMALGGCGTDASEEDATATVERFQAALADDDGRAACAELTPATRDELESDEKASCERAVLALDLRGGGRVAASRVYVRQAFAEIPGHGDVFLDQTPAGWRISAAGCTPAAPNRPYDCELES